MTDGDMSSFDYIIVEVSSVLYIVQWLMYLTRTRTFVLSIFEYITSCLY